MFWVPLGAPKISLFSYFFRFNTWPYVHVVWLKKFITTWRKHVKIGHHFYSFIAFVALECSFLFFRHMWLTQKIVGVCCVNFFVWEGYNYLIYNLSFQDIYSPLITLSVYICIQPECLSTTNNYPNATWQCVKP